MGVIRIGDWKFQLSPSSLPSLLDGGEKHVSHRHWVSIGSLLLGVGPLMLTPLSLGFTAATVPLIAQRPSISPERAEVNVLFVNPTRDDTNGDGTEGSLIQTIGRAARHVRGQAILYADNLTDSMIKAIDETERRRGIQTAYNRMHGITPQSIIKKSSNAILAFLDVSRRLNAQQLEEVYEQADDLSLEQIPDLIKQLEAQMKEAAKNLEFEEAAKYRDRIKNLRDKLVGR